MSSHSHFFISTVLVGILYCQVCLGSDLYSYENYTINRRPPVPQNDTEDSLESEQSQIVAQYSLPLSRNIPTNPLFFGWFYNDKVSNSLRLISEKYLANCYDYIPEFSSFLDRNMYDANITDPFAYFSKPVDPDTGKMDPYYHTTSKFCGRSDCIEYRDKVGKYLGKNFQMHLVGLFFTPKTYGIRIKLTSEEQDIFDVDERKNSLQVAEIAEINDNSIDHQKNKSLSNNVVGHEYEGYFNSGVVSNHPLYPGLHFEPQNKDFHPTESRAHITLGCAPGVDATQTGLDLLEIIDLEVSGHIFHQDFTIGGGDIPKATFRQFGGDAEIEQLAFVLYPTEKMITDATFSVYF